MKLGSEWLLLPVLSQELDEIAFAFGWGQKTPPLLLWPATMLLKRIPLSDNGWLFMHSLDSSRYTSIPRRYGNSLPQYGKPTWKWHLKVQRRSYYRRELFEQGSFHRWCKLTVVVSPLLTIHFDSIIAIKWHPLNSWWTNALALRNAPLPLFAIVPAGVGVSTVCTIGRITMPFTRWDVPLPLSVSSSRSILSNANVVAIWW